MTLITSNLFYSADSITCSFVKNARNNFPEEFCFVSNLHQFKLQDVSTNILTSKKFIAFSKNKNTVVLFVLKMYHVVNTTNQVCSRSITETQKQNFLFKLLRTITRRIKPMNVVYIDRLYICIVDDDVSFF